MEGKGSFFILLVIVAILTLTLAVLAGYIFFVGGTPQTKVEAIASGQMEKRPSENELSSLKLFNEKTIFNLKSDDGEMSVIQLNAILCYYKKVKGIKSTDEKITLNEGKIKEIIGTYFQGLSLEDVRKPEAKQRANEELKKIINEYLTSNEKQKDDIVYSIIFDEWFYQ